MNETRQLYEKIVQLKPTSPKGGGKLPSPFTTPHGQPKLHPDEKFVRLTGTWLKGEYNLYTPFAAQQAAHSSRDGLSPLDHIVGATEMVPAGGRP